ncbi:MAG: peptide chain release factor N(5)-glutamine methyltransferase [Kyrpidia tusciae]|nr:peptide chain release factor N(5)-glutamine methyltransferase [Kyrpidia tusciae]MBE3552392.1 peptide chain release factor N(5)-glutamine methyltransferase [Kyrpidia tusciae]
MTVHEALKAAVAQLRKAGVEDARLSAEVLIQRVLGVGKAHLYAHLDRMLTPAEERRIAEGVSRRARREPLQYITGVVEFYGLELEVGPDVLIPRPETEGLVERVLGWRSTWESPRIVDVGTGSGALAVALAHHWPGARIVGIDVSPGAFQVASRNIRRHGLADRVSLVQGDLLFPLLDHGQRADIVVSNPPYIPSGDIDGLQPEVARFEPRAALDGGGDGLDVYRRLFFQLPEVLARPGAVAVEVGAGQAGAVRRLLEQSFGAVAGGAGGAAAVQMETGTDRDLAGIERVVWARLS